MSTAADTEAIEAIVQTFFSAFTSGPECSERLDALPELFLAEAVIVRTCGMTPAVYGVADFIAPRRALLTGGTLVDFKEWVLSGSIDLFGDIGHWYGAYAKAWTQNGEHFAGRGMKTIQLVRTAAGWRISAAAWDDERDDYVIRDRERGDARQTPRA